MKKVAVLLANGFEEIEALTVVDVLRRANIECKTFSINDIDVLAAHNITVKADALLDVKEVQQYDMLVLPGGMPGTLNLKNDTRVLELVKYFNDKNKFISAICAAPAILEAAGILSGKTITLYPDWEKHIKDGNCVVEPVVVDGKIITSRGAGTALAFSYELLKVLGYDKVEELEKAMIYDIIKK